jgi:SAM-dependent methyltransferase
VPATYDAIGSTYSRHRHADPRWAARIERALGDAERVVNIGAGAGSYEPIGRACVVAVEPSVEMIRQRVPGVPVVRGEAERLPLRTRSFDAALASFTTHHWSDPSIGFREMQRVAARQVVVTWDPLVSEQYWLIRDYLPEAAARERGLATMAAAVEALASARVEPLTVPADLTDGVFAAYWKRPRAYLDPSVRDAISGLALLDQTLVDAAMRRLAADLESGAWIARYGEEVLAVDEIDLGYRLVIGGD